LAWIWRGPGIARVLGWRAGCACLALEGLPPALHPGDAGTARLCIRPRRLPGQDVGAVAVHLDAPGARGVARVLVERFGPPGPVLRPARLRLGRVRPAATLEAAFDVEGIGPRAPGSLRADLHGAVGAVTLRRDPLRPTRGVLEVDVVAPDTPGRHRIRVTVSPAAGLGGPAAEGVLDVEVVADGPARPP
jgi:hypothetical protein